MMRIRLGKADGRAWSICTKEGKAVARLTHDVEGASAGSGLRVLEGKFPKPRVALAGDLMDRFRRRLFALCVLSSDRRFGGLSDGGLGQASV